MGMIDTAIDTLLARLLSSEGKTVTYARGSVSVTGGLTAIKGKPELNIDRMTSVSIEGIDASFILDARDLILSSVVVLPERGDRVTDADGAKWEVVPFESIGCYRKNGNMLRAFVKAIA